MDQGDTPKDGTVNRELLGLHDNQHGGREHVRIRGSEIRRNQNWRRGEIVFGKLLWDFVLRERNRRFRLQAPHDAESSC
jgi:hypothetical protein